MVSKKPEAIRKPLELTIKITVGHKDPDALTRLLIEQRDELTQRGRLRLYIPHFPMEWLRKTGF